MENLEKTWCQLIVSHLGANIHLQPLLDRQTLSFRQRVKVSERGHRHTLLTYKPVCYQTPLSFTYFSLVTPVSKHADQI